MRDDGIIGTIGTFQGQWTLSFVCPDLKFRISAAQSSDPRLVDPIDYQKMVKASDAEERDYAQKLGPICYIHVNLTSLSRPITHLEIPGLATLIREAVVALSNVISRPPDTVIVIPVTHMTLSKPFDVFSDEAKRQ